MLICYRADCQLLRQNSETSNSEMMIERECFADFQFCHHCERDAIRKADRLIGKLSEQRHRYSLMSFFCLNDVKDILRENVFGAVCGVLM
jgi:hypothetical protein